MSNYEKYIKAYQQTPKGKWSRQKSNAKRRGLEWNLTFEEWWAIWEKSGKWEQRGRTLGCYVMSRHNDEGSYSPGNVSIVRTQDNTMEAYVRTTQQATKALRPRKEPKAVVETPHWLLNWNTPEARKVNSFLQ